MLDKIDAYQHEKELEVQEKLKASERKLEKAKKAGNAEGWPFQGTPFDPSKVNFSGSPGGGGAP